MIATPMLTACSQKPTSNEAPAKVPKRSRTPIHVSDQAATAPTSRESRPVRRSPRARPSMATTATGATPPKRYRSAPRSEPPPFGPSVSC